MWIGHRKEIRKLTFRALALRRSESRTPKVYAGALIGLRSRTTHYHVTQHVPKTFPNETVDHVGLTKYTSDYKKKRE